MANFIYFGRIIDQLKKINIYRNPLKRRNKGGPSMFDKNQEELKRKRDKAIDILKEWEKTLDMKHGGTQEKVSLKEEKEINSKIQYTGVI